MVLLLIVIIGKKLVDLIHSIMVVTHYDAGFFSYDKSLNDFYKVILYAKSN